MKNLIIFLSILLNANSFSCDDRYGEGQSRSLIEIVDSLQSKFSYRCGINKFTKRKVIYDCKSDNAHALVTLKKNPKINDFGEGLESLKIDFKESKDFPDLNESVNNVLSNIELQISFSCGVDVLKNRRSSLKAKSDCRMRMGGEYLGVGEVIWERADRGTGKWKSFSVEFKKEDNK